MIVDSLDFIGAWLLFIFPMYQGIIDINDQDVIVANIVKKNLKQSSAFARNVSRFLWLIPPLKIHFERERSLKIMREAHNDVSFDDVYSLINKATAWVYIAFAGALNGIVVTNNWLKDLEIDHRILLLFIISGLMINISIFYIGYRISSHRKQKMYRKAHSRSQKRIIKTKEN